MIIQGDCFELIKDLPDNSVDLVITSPPYADICNYGKDISIKKPQDYCDWLLPLFNEIQRTRGFHRGSASTRRAQRERASDFFVP